MTYEWIFHIAVTAACGVYIYSWIERRFIRNEFEDLE